VHAFSGNFLEMLFFNVFLLEIAVNNGGLYIATGSSLFNINTLLQVYYCNAVYTIIYTTT